MSSVIGASFESSWFQQPDLDRKNIDDHPLRRPLATALWRARSRAAALPPSYTTRWDTTVHQLLINEKYVGDNVWNRGSFKLKKKRVRNTPDMWIRADGAFEAIVDRVLFEAAQAIIRALPAAERRPVARRPPPPVPGPRPAVRTDHRRER